MTSKELIYDEMDNAIEIWGESFVYQYFVATPFNHWKYDDFWIVQISHPKLGWLFIHVRGRTPKEAAIFAISDLIKGYEDESDD